MFVDTSLPFTLTLTAAGGTTYLVAPVRCKVSNVRGVIQDAAGVAAISVTLTAPSHGSGVTLGVAAFAASSGIAAKSVATYTANASTGGTIVSAGSILQATVAAASSLSCAAAMYIDIDPYAS